MSGHSTSTHQGDAVRVNVCLEDPGDDGWVILHDRGGGLLVFSLKHHDPRWAILATSRQNQPTFRV